MRFDRKPAQKVALLAATAALSLAATTALAADRVWTGLNGGTGHFRSDFNWGPPVAPTAIDRAIFSSAAALRATVEFDLPQTVLGAVVVGQSAVGPYILQNTGTGALTSNGTIQIGDGSTVTPVQLDGLGMTASVTHVLGNATLLLVSNASLHGQIHLLGTGAVTVLDGLVGADVNHEGTGIFTVTGGLVQTSVMDMYGGGRMEINSGGRLQILDHAAVRNSSTLTVNTGGSILFGGANAELLVANSGELRFNSSHALSDGARLRVESGGDVIAFGFLDLGNGNTGSLSVDGAGSTIGAASSSDWGNGGVATVSFSNSGVGTYSTLDLARTGGTADVQLLSSSQLTTTSSLTVGPSTGTSSLARISVIGSTLNNAGTSIFRNGGQLIMSSGGVNFTGNGTFGAGSTFTMSGGNLNIASGKTLNIAGGVVNKTGGSGSLSNGATLRITAGTFTTNSFFDIANGSGAVTGTMIVDGATARFNSTSGTSDWGQNVGNVATVTLANGGVGTYSGGLQIADNGGKALVNINSGAQLNANNLIVGGAASAATINIGGGTLNALGTANFNNGALVNLTSGGLMLNGNATLSNGATLNHSGGEMIIAAGKTLNVAGGTINNTTAGRALSDGATINITSGKFSNSAYFDVANGAATGTLIVNGPAATYSAGVISDWGRSTGNAATVSISNSGQGTLATLRMSSAGGSSTLNLQTNGRLTIIDGLDTGNATATANVRINIAGGTLNSASNTFLRGGTVVNWSSGSLNVGGMLDAQDNAQVLLTAGGDKVLRVGGLNISANSKIDLNDNDMIVAPLTPKISVEGYVATARNGGAWNGARGITSTAAKNSIPKNKTLGVLSGAEYNSVGGTGIFSGQSYSPAHTLVKFTWYGDTDFNGLVDFDDYSRIDSGFNGNRTGWINGDVDSNGIVDFDDYSLVDQAFNTQSGTLRQAMAYLDGGGHDSTDMNRPELRVVVEHFEQFGQPYANAFLAAVPEPTASALLATLGAATLLPRRRRRRR